MGFFGAIKDYFDTKSVERQQMEAMKREIDIQYRLEFEKEYKQNSLEVAKERAKQDALQKSGLAKMRAINRVSRLDEGGPPPGSILEKLSDYTKKNLAKRDENLARTKIMREEAKRTIASDQAKRETERTNRMINRPTSPIDFNKSNNKSKWRM